MISTETSSPTVTPSSTATPILESYTGNVEDFSVTVIREKYKTIVVNHDAGVYRETFYKDDESSYLDDNVQLVCAVAELGVMLDIKRTVICMVRTQDRPNWSLLSQMEKYKQLTCGLTECSVNKFGISGGDK